MRLDHIAYRTKDRQETARFFIDAFGYRVQEEFEIVFEDGSTAKCIALEPPELPEFEMDQGGRMHVWTGSMLKDHVYHSPPEIFVSDGTPDSIVGQWVAERGGVGGIHHLAYEVDDVEKTMRLWQEKGWAEFTTDHVLSCPGLDQVFTKPSPLTGVIYEFIKRDTQGFCKDNVRELMSSTKNT